MISIKEFHFPGFDLHICYCAEQTTRRWTPHTGEYAKNLFCSYITRGRMDEYNMLGEHISSEIAPKFVNSDVTQEFPTVEIVSPNTEWLCFSSNMPFTGRIDHIIPADAAAYSVDDKKYIAPTSGMRKIPGTVIVFGRGEFVNMPEIHRERI